MGGLVNQGPACEKIKEFKKPAARDAIVIKSAHNCKNKGTFKAEECQTTAGN